MVSPLPRAAAIVLNYRTPQDTLLAVRSIQASRRPVQALVVVDNGSADGSEAYLREHLSGITFIQTGRNLGFSGGANAGIRTALEGGAELALLVNSDVILPPDCLGRLEDALAGELGAGIAGPVTLSRSDPDRVASLGIAFSPVTGRMRHRGVGERFDTLALPARSVVDGVSGCVMLIRRAVIERVGLFAEEYFFSFEDLDFCLRARRAGLATVLAGDAVAYHEGGRSIGARSPRRVYFATRNHLLLAARAAPRRGVGGLVRSAHIVALNLAHALGPARVPRVEGLRAVLVGTWHHLRGRYGGEP